ncbi:MAG: hypothetical protein ABII79_08760 [bacterium]
MKRRSLIVFLILVFVFGSTQAVDEITLDEIVNISNGGTVVIDSFIPPGDTIRLTFRLTHTSGTQALYIVSNPFSIYQRNSDPFIAPTCDTLSIDWSSMFTYAYLEECNSDGYGGDTIHFVGIDTTGSTGLPVGFDQQVWYIETGSDSLGNTICIDSSVGSYCNSFVWGWWPVGGGFVKPQWDGPHCFKVGYSCGDIDGSVTRPDVGDLTFLVAFLFDHGPTPPSVWSANVDGDYQITVGDLTYLVAYLFQGGPAPTCAPVL